MYICTCSIFSYARLRDLFFSSASAVRSLTERSIFPKRQKLSLDKCLKSARPKAAKSSTYRTRRTRSSDSAARQSQTEAMLSLLAVAGRPSDPRQQKLRRATNGAKSSFFRTDDTSSLAPSLALSEEKLQASAQLRYFYV